MTKIANTAEWHTWAGLNLHPCHTRFADRDWHGAGIWRRAAEAELARCRAVRDARLAAVYELPVHTGAGDWVAASLPLEPVR